MSITVNLHVSIDLEGHETYLFAQPCFGHLMAWKGISLKKYGLLHECCLYEKLEPWLQLFGHLMVLNTYTMVLRLWSWCSSLVWIVTGWLSPAYCTRGSPRCGLPRWHGGPGLCSRSGNAENTWTEDALRTRSHHTGSQWANIKDIKALTTLDLAAAIILWERCCTFSFAKPCLQDMKLKLWSSFYILNILLVVRFIDKFLFGPDYGFVWMLYYDKGSFW